VLGCKGHFLCLLCISFLILFLQATGQFEQMSSRNYIEIDRWGHFCSFFFGQCVKAIGHLWMKDSGILNQWVQFTVFPQLWNTRCLHG